MIYTIGYSGMPAPRLQQIVTALNAILVDVRFRAASRIATWNKGALVKQFGDKYIHLPQLGNSLYREGGMQIADYEAGLAAISVIMVTLEKPVVLMCACASPVECHRTHLADLLRTDGYEVAELTSTLIKEALENAPKSPQLSLWSEL